MPKFRRMVNIRYYASKPTSKIIDGFLVSSGIFDSFGLEVFSVINRPTPILNPVLN